jgi:predicted DNA-binding protein
MSQCHDVPKTPLRDEKITVTVRLPLSVKKRLEQYAAKTKRTLGGYLELALEAQFAKDNTDGKR